MAWAIAGSRSGMGGYELQDHLSEQFFRPAGGYFANFSSSVGSNSEETNLARPFILSIFRASVINPWVLFLRMDE